MCGSLLLLLPPPRYAKATVGDPLAGALMGPLHREAQVAQYLEGIERAKAAGGKVRFGGRRVEHALGGFFVQPALVEMPGHVPVMHEELFVPILYAVKLSASPTRCVGSSDLCLAAGSVKIVSQRVVGSLV